MRFDYRAAFAGRENIMVGSGFNYSASSFLNSARHPGFWSRARLVSEGAHRQYRVHGGIGVQTKAPDGIFHGSAIAFAEMDEDREIQRRHAA